jgi:hypothetical protein
MVDPVSSTSRYRRQSSIARWHAQGRSGLKILGTARHDGHRAALARSGKRNQARELLAPGYSRFTGGGDMRDLKEPKAVFKELS